MAVTCCNFILFLGGWHWFQKVPYPQEASEDGKVLPPFLSGRPGPSIQHQFATLCHAFAWFHATSRGFNGYKMLQNLQV